MVMLVEQLLVLIDMDAAFGRVLLVQLVVVLLLVMRVLLVSAGLIVRWLVRIVWR